MNNLDKVDAVYTYVDGGDPKFLKKLNFYRSQEGNFDQITNNTKTRYDNINEILYSLASLFKFAPFVDKIYIVTYEQEPNFKEFIAKHYPERLKDIIIIDHKILFGMYPEIYPTFNSTSIEAFLHKIPNLKENYIYFNDDMILIKPIEKSDWFINDKPVFLGKWKLGKLFKHLKFQRRQKRNLEIPMNYTYRNYLGSRLAGFKYIFPYVLHTPKPLSKSLTEKAFNENKEVILKNSIPKFREAHTFNATSFYTSYNLKFSGNKISYQKEIYIDFSNQNKSYLEKKLNLLRKNIDNKYLCIQSLNEAPQNFQKELISILVHKFELK